MVRAEALAPAATIATLSEATGSAAEKGFNVTKKDTSAKKEPIKHWITRRKVAADVLFALTKDKKGFKYNSRPDIVKEVYRDRLNPLLGTPEYDQKYDKCSSLLTGVIEGVNIMLRKVAANPNNKKLPLEARKFWEKLKAQSEYASVTIEDLILVAKREIEFTELQNITIGNNPQAVVEKSSDKSPLTITQVVALGTLLGGSEYQPLLQKYGINISQSQIDEDIKNILAFCRQAAGASFTDTTLKNSFPLLAEYLQEFVEGNRIEFLNNNTDQAKTLLEMIPDKITPDNFRLLMNDIREILNFEPFQRREQVRLRAVTSTFLSRVGRGV